MTEGLRWMKCDLHIHTPASSDHRYGEDVDAAAIVAALEGMGVELACVTDHCSGAWVDALKAAAGNSNLVVLPGFEVDVPGLGHLLAVFPEDRNGERIKNVIGALKIPADDQGDPDSQSGVSIEETLVTVQRHGGLAVLAHVGGPKGFLQVGDNKSLRRMLKRGLIAGAQVANEEEADALDARTRSVGIRLAKFASSDAHATDKLGSKFSYFKLGEPTHEAIRQCLLDPETRISNSYSPVAHPRIVSMHASKGFLAGTTYGFHGSLNCIVGGAGVGKSLVVEFLRFALGSESPISEVMTDRYGKLRERLGIGGEVVVDVVASNGVPYRVVRTYDGLKNNTVIYDLFASSLYEGSIASLFPLVAYSQNEALKIADDSRAQRDLIDDLSGVAWRRREIDRLAGDLEANLDAYMRAVLAGKKARDLQKSVTDLQAEIDDIGSKLQASEFEIHKEWDGWSAAAETLQTTSSELLTRSSEALDALEAMAMPEVDSECGDQAALLAYGRLLSSARDMLIVEIRAAAQGFSSRSENASRYLREFETARQEHDREYQEFVKTVGGDAQLWAVERTKKQEELGKLKARLSRELMIAQGLKGLSSERSRLLAELEQAIENRFQARRAIYKRITTRTNRRLSMTVKQGEAISGYASVLDDLATGTWIHKNSLARLAKLVGPFRFVEMVVAEDSARLAKHWGETQADAAKLISHIISNEARFQTLLRLPWGQIPDDVPDIKLRQKEGKYAPLLSLSVGQKCIALLSIALALGTRPVVIDQPEDALDVASVYDDIVTMLRAGKESRQFILTTHNPNIAVGSDTDKYHVLGPAAATAVLVCGGGLETRDVKRSVVDQLEGGERPYTIRGRKYGLLN